ncbi:MAG: prepilin-type N-terminal cleavage/methylation domain-containing protein [Candidatus Zixiibacteriota bacterium]|nr:MAG: prepilin-type N-terminal cleavage/methylation domain-containing protein [candidate division Zixibacteria bacterium]
MKKLIEKIAKNNLGNGDSGFTMVEILIALIVASVVISVAFELYITQHNQLLVQEDVSEIQGNARAAAELLAEEIRKTGFLLPGIVTSMEAANSNPDTLVIKYATPKLAGVYLDQPMVTGSDVLRCTGNPLNELVAGDWVFIYDEAADTGEAFVVTDVNYQYSAIYHDLNPLGRAYPAGSALYAIARNKFYVDYSNHANPNLMIERLGQSPEIYAENIEHLDFEYYLEDGTSTTMYANPFDVRMIGINVRAKSLRPELNSPNGDYRKRDFSLKVKLRNFGLS